MVGGSEQGGGVVVTFHSCRDGIGRTMTVVNLAILLSREGLRVLLVAADSGDEPYDRYLSRMTGGERNRPVTLDGLVARWRTAPRDEQGFPPDLADALTRVHLDPAAREGGFDLLGLDTRALSTGTPPEAEEPRFAGWLRAGVRAAGYDYVLVDARSGMDDAGLALAARLSDMVVGCFTLSPRSIDESAEALERIRAAAARPVRFVPLAMRVDPGADEALRNARELCRRRFAGLADASALGQEIPYQVDYYYSETLAALSEPPGREGGLRQAYERFAEVITDGRYTALTAVTVLYTPPYRDWGEWIAGRIEQGGVHVTFARLDRHRLPAAPGRDHAILVVSPAGLDAATSERLRTLMHPASRGPSPGTPGPPRPAATGSGRSRAPDVWAVRVDDADFPAELTGHPPIDLRGLPEELATVELRRRLRLTGPVPTGAMYAGTPRFPRRPVLSNALGRNLFFVGRDDLIERIRDHLTTGPGHGCLLAGGPGLGKSQIALEYSHRFGGSYDLVWWVNAGTGEAVQAGLGALAAELGLPTGGDAARAVLRHLLSGEVARWLLVYDNADDPRLLAGLLPGESPYGHVLVTSRNPDWGPSLHPMSVGRFSRDESVALVRRWVPHIPDDDAAKAADAAAHLPIAVHLAATWLRQEAAAQRVRMNLAEETAARVAARTFLDAFDEEVSRHPSGGSGDDLAHRVTVALALASLRRGAGHAAAVWLAQACSFLSADGIGLPFLRSPRMRETMARADHRLSDPIMTDAVLRSLDRQGLARIDLGRADPVRVHRLVQAVIRESMSPQEQAERNAEVLSALAAYAPDDFMTGAPDRAVFTELAAHVFPASAPASADPAVRRWLVGQVRFHRRRMDNVGARMARAIGDAALAHWEASGDHAYLPELRAELSDTYRVLGEHRKAAALAADALRDQTRNLGSTHPRTLLTATTYAVALRTLGDFDEAYAWDDAALKGFRELYGADHAFTGTAMNNLAVSHRLRGDSHEAIRLADDRVRRRVRIFGEYDPDALWTKCNLATYLREAGDYQGSLRVLKEILSYLGFVEKEPSQIRTPLALRVESGLAVTERMLGRSFDALYRDLEIIDDFRQVHGDDHLGTLMCRLSLAADLHAEQRSSEAVAEARACLESFRRLYGEHPFTYMCQANLAVYLRGAGGPAEAGPLGAAGHDWLLRHLGPRHPSTLAAAVNHAGTLIALGDVELGLDLERDACLRLTDMLGAAHPHAVIAAANVAATRAMLDGPLGGPLDGSPDGAGHALEAGPSARRDIDIEVPGL
jgi:tetratricopeptide (TPR) repeat protein/cellulose biosynthesis protein BcsQ